MSNPHRLEPDIMTTGEIMTREAVRGADIEKIVHIFDREMSKLELAYVKLKEECERRNAVIEFLWGRLYEEGD